MKKTQPFVPQSLNKDPEAITEELRWIRTKMLETHNSIVKSLDLPIDIQESKKGLITSTKQARDSAIESLMYDLQEYGTENSSMYYRRLNEYAQPKVDAVSFMDSLVTYISEIGIRIHDLEKGLKERN